MSQSWTNVLQTKKTIPNKQKIVKKEETEKEVFTENCEIEKNFMDFYGYKTSLLWNELLDTIGVSPLFNKLKSSSKLHDFMYNNIDLDLKKIGIIEDDTEESTDDFIE